MDADTKLAGGKIAYHIVVGFAGFEVKGNSKPFIRIDAVMFDGRVGVSGETFELLRMAVLECVRPVNCVELQIERTKRRGRSRR